MEENTKLCPPKAMELETDTFDSTQIDAHWYFGGVASMAACVITHPLNLLRIQTQGHLPPVSAKEAFAIILKHRGIAGLYNGLISNIQRQLVFAVTRFGFYETAKHCGYAENFRRKVLIAAIGGLCAGYINTPLEKVTTRMRTDVMRPPEQQRGYRSAFHGAYKLYKLGGIRSLYIGSVPAALRGMTMTIGQVSVYNEVKSMLLETERFRDNWRSYFISSMIAGSIATILTTPLAVVKLIQMNAKRRKFRGSWHAAKTILEKHGVRGFYRGLTISFLHLVPQTVLTFMLYEQLRLHYGVYEVYEQ